MATYNVGYDFNPNDVVYILDGTDIEKATCLQVTIKISSGSNNAIQTSIEYLSLLDCNKGTVVSTPDNTYATAEEAFAAYLIKIALPC